MSQLEKKYTNVSLSPRRECLSRVRVTQSGGIIVDAPVNFREMPSPKKNQDKKVMARTPRSTRTAARKEGKRKISDVTDDENFSSGDNDSDAYEEPRTASDDDDDAVSLHSDALDDDEFEVSRSSRKKGSKSPSKKKSESKAASPSKKVNPKTRSLKKRRKDDDEDDEEDFDDGLEIVGTVVQAPTTGLGMYTLLDKFSMNKLCFFQVPPGRISQNTLNFLRQLMDPACNDREWYVIFYYMQKLCFDFLNFVSVGSNYTVCTPCSQSVKFATEN